MMEVKLRFPHWRLSQSYLSNLGSSILSQVLTLSQKKRPNIEMGSVVVAQLAEFYVPIIGSNPIIGNFRRTFTYSNCIEVNKKW